MGCSLSYLTPAHSGRKVGREHGRSIPFTSSASRSVSDGLIVELDSLGRGSNSISLAACQGLNSPRGPRR